MAAMRRSHVCVSTCRQTLTDALRVACESPCETWREDAGAGHHGFTTRRLGRIEIHEAQGEPLKLETQGCRREHAQVTALLQIEGRALVRQGERSARLEAGELCLVRACRPLELDQAAAFRMTLVSVPEVELAERSPIWRAALVAAIATEAGVPAIFRETVASLQRWSCTLGESSTDGIADAMVDLIGAVICNAMPVNRDCLQRSLYHRDRIKRFAQLNLANPDLSVESIAAAVGLSARQIHRLFAEEQMSLMRWIWVQRLERCYRDLAQGGADQRSISEIAFAWGFNDQAHFSRSFRKHFGISPRDLRRRAAA